MNVKSVLVKLFKKKESKTIEYSYSIRLLNGVKDKYIIMLMEQIKKQKLPFINAHYDYPYQTYRKYKDWRIVCETKKDMDNIINLHEDILNNYIVYTRKNKLKTYEN